MFRLGAFLSITGADGCVLLRVFFFKVPYYYASIRYGSSERLSEERKDIILIIKGDKKKIATI